MGTDHNSSSPILSHNRRSDAQRSSHERRKPHSPSIHRPEHFAGTKMVSVVSDGRNCNTLPTRIKRASGKTTTLRSIVTMSPVNAALSSQQSCVCQQASEDTAIALPCPANSGRCNRDYFVCAFCVDFPVNRDASNLHIARRMCPCSTPYGD